MDRIQTECNILRSLRGLLNIDGTNTSELGRKIGTAMKYFSTLQRIWFHANITIRRNIAYFKVLILARLMYGIDSMWLNQYERRSLYAFQAKCLRRIIKISHAYWSRI